MIRVRLPGPALRDSPEARLLIGGIGPSDKATEAALRQGRRLGVDDRMQFIGYLSPERLVGVMAASDVLAHPARLDVTGAVILEAAINGLPVVVTGNCGFTGHIARSGAGMVLDGPFDGRRFRQMLDHCCSQAGSEMSRRGIEYGYQLDAFDGLSAICDWIEADSW